MLQELAERGIPVTNISSVSGGSIIAGFVGMGGAPADFVEFVKAGRFRLIREMTNAVNLPRWIIPFGSFTRRDVQSALLRRVLLGGVAPDLPPPRPLVMFGVTDLAHAMSIGISDQGYQFSGIAASRFFSNGSGMTMDAIGDLADRVALSGAFPGVFPAKEVVARYTLSEQPLAESPFVRDIRLELLDGGARDNLGLNLLLAINREARGTGNTSLPWKVFEPGEDWKLDAIIVSDGGQSLDATEPPLSIAGQVMRAIEVSGLATGIFRPIESSPDLPVLALSIASQLSLTPGTEIVDLPNADPRNTRLQIFKLHPISGRDLDRLAAVNPQREATEAAVRAFRSFDETQPLDLSDIHSRCATAATKTRACAWLKLVNLIMDDIDATAQTFRQSPTLLDQYSAADADALVRLGRYFVILRGTDIDRAISQAASARLPAPGG